MHNTYISIAGDLIYVDVTYRILLKTGIFNMKHQYHASFTSFHIRIRSWG